MNIALITIGSELLNGTRVDTNAQWIGNQLSQVGAKVSWRVSVCDIAKDIQEALRSIPSKIDLVLCTGGLGPTTDDLTLETLCDFFNSEIEFDQKYWSELQLRLQKRTIKITEAHKTQALSPKDANILPNSLGSARGLHFKGKDFELFAMPGVPDEMKSMMTDCVIPQIKNTSKEDFFYKIIRTTGATETKIFEAIKDVLEEYSVIDMSYLPSVFGVDIRCSCEDENTLQNFLNKISPLIDQYIYGEGHTKLEEVVAHLLTEKGKTLAVAESCSGGLISHRLTNVPGSSRFFLASVVTYANECKKSLLSVKEESLQAYGAVSEQVAYEMAENVRKKFECDLGVSVTGIAGPSNNSTEKQLGLCFIGIANREKTEVHCFQFTKDRIRNKNMTSQAALNLIRKSLL